VRAILVVLLAASALAVPLAHAQGSLTAAAAPATAQVAPGGDARTNFTFSNGLAHDITLTFSFAGPAAVHVSYRNWTVTVPANGKLAVPTLVHVDANATPGDITVDLLAQDVAHALPEIKAPLTLRILGQPTTTAATAQAIRLTPQDVNLSAGGETVVHAMLGNKGSAPWTPTLLFQLPAGVSATPAFAPQPVPPGGYLDVPITLRAAADATTGDAEGRILASPAAAPFRLHVAQAAPPLPPARGGGTALLVAAGGGVTAMGASALLLRRRWPFLAAALYTRLAPHRVLDQPTRNALADLVHAEPGIAFGEAARRLDLGAGALTYHARVLERSGVIFSARDGQQRRFYPVAGGRVAGAPSLAERALDGLRAGPRGLAELARELGVSRQALHYHLKRMAKEGRVRAEGSGRGMRYATV
jgi:DNA-binding transcriptional ArsR family regulator